MDEKRSRLRIAEPAARVILLPPEQVFQTGGDLTTIEPVTDNHPEAGRWPISGKPPPSPSFSSCGRGPAWVLTVPFSPAGKNAAQLFRSLLPEPLEGIKGGFRGVFHF